MNIIIKKVGMPHELKVIESLKLDDMQNMVGGYIECLHVGNGVDMWLNDSGKIFNLPINMVLGSEDREILDTIQGDVFFAGSDGYGETIGLSEEQVSWVKRKLESGDFAMAHTQNGIEFVPIWVYAPHES